MLKHYVELFSRLYIVMQHRESDMGTFFKHENHPYPHSLSDRGKLRQGKESDLLSILLEEVEIEEPPIWFDVKVLDELLLSTSCPQPTLLLLKSMPMLFLFPTSSRICTLASVLMLYGILTSPAVSKSQQGKSEAKEFEEGGDTDVVIIIIGKFHALTANHPAADIWIAFGTGKNFMYIHINTICNALGRNRSMALPIFHSFTGCDTTSSFWGRGKKSAWEAWKAYPEVTKAFLYMVSNPHLPITVEAQHFQLLEHFTVILYDKTSDLEFVDEARRELFCHKNRTMENIPPTQDAHLQHCKRVGYQAGIWTTSDMAQQQTPPPGGHGWTLDKESYSYIPVWITLPLASQACTELVKCGCKSKNGCGGRCSCKKAQWKCTELCSCTCDK